MHGGLCDVAGPIGPSRQRCTTASSPRARYQPGQRAAQRAVAGQVGGRRRVDQGKCLDEHIWCLVAAVAGLRRSAAARGVPAAPRRTGLPPTSARRAADRRPGRSAPPRRAPTARWRGAPPSRRGARRQHGRRRRLNEGGSAPLLTELPSRAVTSVKRAARPSSRLEADVSGAGSAVLCERVSERCDLAARRRGHLGQDCSPHDQDQHQEALAPAGPAGGRLALRSPRAAHRARPRAWPRPRT